MTDPKTAADRFDPRDLPPAFYEDPYPLYAALREFDPVHRCPDGSWFITRYADALAIYRDHRSLSSDKQVEFAPKFGDGSLFGHHTTSLVFRDPPYHTTVRKLIARFFTPRALAAMEPRLIALVDGMLDRIQDQGRADLIKDFAFALPVEVVCDLLGVPRADREQLRDWARLILGALEPVLPPDRLASGNHAVDEFSAYLSNLVEHKRQRGPDDEVDVLSALVQTMDNTQEITEYELVQNCIFLLNAGHETTTNLIGNGVNSLFAHPAEYARLQSMPELIETAVEEFLRFEPSNQLGNRRAVAPLELSGHRLPVGALLTICIGAANRDPAQFPEPNRLDLSRTPNRHLSFAAGIHTCAGAVLARLEAKVAIGRLIARFPRLRPSGPAIRDPRMRFRVIRSMPVDV